MIEDFKRDLLPCTYCMANIHSISQWNLHHFYSIISKLLGLILQNFKLKKKKGEIPSKWSEFHALSSLLGFYTTK